MIKPILDRTLAAYDVIDAYSDDQLRDKAQEIKGIIADRIAADEEKKRGLRQQLETGDMEPQEKEKIATEVDKLTKQIDDKIEEVLNEVLPDAFAVMKSTARRFKEHGEIVVKATDADRDLSTKVDYVRIEGIMQSGRTAGWPEATWLHGIWFTMMYSLLAVLYCIRERLLRWLPERVRHWLQHCRYSSMPLQGRVFML